MPAKAKRLIAFACAALVIVGAGLLLIGPRSRGATAAGASATKHGQTPPTIELSVGQLAALQIEPVQTRSFPVEKVAVGSISFEEDPAIVQAESMLVGTAATADLTTRELARVRSLGEGNGIAQKELEQALASDQTARAALRAARDAVRALGKSDAEIDRMIATGRIQSASPAQRARKWALANVAESDSVSVRAGQAVSLRVLAYPDLTFQGKVSRVYAAVDPTTHRVAVRAEIADPGNELRAGMLADVAIQVREPVRSLAIPANGAVREADGTTTVWVTADRRHFSQRTVRTGERSAGWVQILDGVRPGELAVTDGAVFLSNMLQAPPSD